METELITCGRTHAAGQAHPNTLPGNSSPHEWDAAVAADRRGQPDRTKLNINKNLATSRQAVWLPGLIIAEAMGQTAETMGSSGVSWVKVSPWTSLTFK